jgi:hypothetical protein
MGNALHSAELIESVKQDFTDILVQSLANGHNYQASSGLIRPKG